MTEKKRALRINASQFTRLIKINRATSRYAERDVLMLMLMLGHHCGRGPLSRLSLPEAIIHGLNSRANE